MTNIDYRQLASDLADNLLADRLAAAGRPAGLRDAVIELAVDAFAHGGVEQLLRQQLDQLLNPNSRSEPDAYLADEAAIEDALQRAAAGLHTANARNGVLLDPLPFERSTATRLADDPRFALRAELARIPRPITRPDPLHWSLEPAPWAHERGEQPPWPPDGLRALASQRCLPGGPAALARVDSGPHTDWVQVALIEQHVTPARSYPESPRRQIFVFLGIEVTDHEPPSASLPLGSSPWQLWTTTSRPRDLSASQIASQLATVDSPLVAFVDNGRNSPWLRRTGPGAPPFALVPLAPLIIVFDLVPTPRICGFSLSDSRGPALISRHWRGHPVHDGNYQPLFPSVEGTDLILRPDLFDRLRALAGESRIHTGVAAFHQPGVNAENT
ncbi:hypothetical protein [Amycolatopsis panacis]|uniref:Uncharacterized protein n=1 Tax=Amycolatopsis panacis TaxID=2340917 RepID=A0A419IBZ9_9PSEU|nr:hypothetical protein [Amycolatopsis panacis]RJQ92767.1 hypothetical protein D5S19_00175 [Amycolatopsis panacis]